MALDVALCREDTFPCYAHGDMNVRCASGIGSRLDAAEVVIACRAGEKTTVALEVGIASSSAAAAAVNVVPVAVGLPDFDDGIPDGAAGGALYRSAQVRDFTNGGSDLIVDENEIVVGIERKLIGVERPLGLTWRFDQSLRESARCSQEE